MGRIFLGGRGRDFSQIWKTVEKGSTAELPATKSPWSWFNPDVRHSFQHGQTAHNVNSGDETKFGGHLHVLRHESKLVVKASVRGLGRSKVESNDLLGKHNKHPLSRKRIRLLYWTLTMDIITFCWMSHPWECNVTLWAFRLHYQFMPTKGTVHGLLINVGLAWAGGWFHLSNSTVPDHSC